MVNYKEGSGFRLVKPGDIVEFDKVKTFKHVKVLGHGGTGDTHLFEEEATDMFFAIKKYAPKGTNDTEENFQRFIDEIKILFKISHPNIVRIYNYYLYPESKYGYLQMEHIDGVTIDNYNPFQGGKTWENLFAETITAFEYLEKIGILHRDIRAANIMVDKNHVVKIIDFGFGKKLLPNEINGKSVFLNWPVSEYPDEVVNGNIYNHQTEVFFLGKLFEKEIGSELHNFGYQHVIEKMTLMNPYLRYSSFSEISSDISQGFLAGLEFSLEEKETYQMLADILLDKIFSYVSEFQATEDVDIVLNNLQELIRRSSLETYIQDNSQLINCFVRNAFKYNSNISIKVEIVKKFYETILGFSDFKRKIVIDNINTRLSTINVDFSSDELPF